MDKFLQIGISVLGICLLSSCVSQNYSDENKPVVQNEASNNEIAMTRISLGLGYLKMGNTSQAKLNLEKAKYYAPKLVQVHTAFAHYYETVGEAELAITAYETALNISANDADTLNNYGVFLCRQGRIDDAEKQLLKAINVPSYILVSESYENLATCQLNANHFVKAEQYYDKAIAHNPSNASTLLQMTRLQYAKADYKSAQNFLGRFEKATRRFSSEALALAFKIYQQQGQNQIAKNYAAMLLKMFPASYEAKQYLLNELVEIEADKLAHAYQTNRPTEVTETSTKRVIKLSPNKAMNTSIAVTKPVTPELNKAGQNKAEQKQEPKVLVKVAAEVEKPATVNVHEQAQKQAQKQAQPHEQEQATMTLPIHVAVKGDSLFSISKKYNVNFSQLLRWNNIKKSNVLKIGDVIYLADPKKATIN